jgi:hypothetical protein
VTTISQEAYADMFRECSNAFRIEGEPAYVTSPAEAEALTGFLAGKPQPPSAFPVWQSWLDQVRVWTSPPNGKAIVRVRIIDNPPTGYQRWSLWCTAWHRDAGEDIRYLARETADALGIPRGDWQMFDHKRLVLMAFTPTGKPSGKTLVTDPDTILKYRSWRSLALRYATAAEAMPV